MKKEAVTLAVTGLKEAGIDFITSLPSKSIADLIFAISDDPDFTHVPVANENDAISICAGAWLSGKKTAFICQNSGLVLATYALLDAIYFFQGFPMLLVADHRGDFGDAGGYWFYGYGMVMTKFFEAMGIPYTIVRERSKLANELRRGEITAETYGKPVAVLLSGEEIW